MNKEEKEKRKEEIRKNREEFKRIGIKGYYIEPLKEYWKKNTKKAISVFLVNLVLFYLIFSIIVTTNNTLIYCNSTIPEYNGKMDYVHAPFIKNYNTKVKAFNKGLITKEELTQEEYKIQCTYDLETWWNETTKTKAKDWWYGYKKTILKR